MDRVIYRRDDIAASHRLHTEILETVIKTRIIHQYDLMVSQKLAKLPMSFIDTSHGRDTVDYLKYSRDEVVNLTHFITNVFFGAYTFIISFYRLSVLIICILFCFSH